VSRPGKLAAALAEQVASNRSALGHEAAFAAHRARMTEEIAARAPAGRQGRLCLLGIGNANDVDLVALADRFGLIHLADVDGEAVDRALARVPDPLRPRFVTHVPLELSGMLDRLESPKLPADAELVAKAVSRVVGALPGPFDVVVSCSLLTQLQLVLLQVAGETHPRFEALRAALGAIHVRTLAGLLAPRGVALLVTDLTTSDIYPPLDHLDPDTDLEKLMADLLAAGHVIYAAHPGMLSAEIRRDPELARRFAVRSPVGPWLWRNGPTQTLLVYALEIRAREEVS
jgi:hypothetical protein